MTKKNNKRVNILLYLRDKKIIHVFKHMKFSVALHKFNSLLIFSFAKLVRNVIFEKNKFETVTFLNGLLSIS